MIKDENVTKENSQNKLKNKLLTHLMDTITAFQIFACSFLDFNIIFEIIPYIQLQMFSIKSSK